MNYRTFIYKQKDKIRKKLKKHPKLQKSTTRLYLKYCSLTGFMHILPNYYIIGFPKCGTTSLHFYLGEHSCIHLPIGKEIDYFDRLYSRGLNWYRVSFPFRFQFLSNKILGKQFITGEATPRYINHPHALQRIKKTTPNAKFIIILRNPIDRAYSHYTTNLEHDYEHLSFEDAIKHEKERTKGRWEKMERDENYYSWDRDLYSYLEHGIYYPKIKKWFSEFPREQFLIIQTERFQKNPSETYHKALKFLNLPNFNLEKYVFYKKRDYKKSKILDSTRKELFEFFKPHNEQLYEFLGRRFDWDK